MFKRLYLRIDSYAYPRFVVPAVALLPARVAYSVAVLRASILFKWERETQNNVERSVDFLFGNRYSLKEKRQIAIDFLRNQSCKTIDAMRLLGDGRALLRLIEVKGLENLRAALNKEKGAILCSAHFGSPTCCFSVIGAMGFPVTLLARWSFMEHENKFPLRLIHRLQGNKPVNSHLRRPNILAKFDNIGSAVQAANVLRGNEVLGIMIDASTGKKAVGKKIKVDFLGGELALAPGVIKIAQLTGAPILTMVLHRSRDWSHLVLEISEPILIDRDTVASYQRCLSVLEEAIERYPAQWSRLRNPTLLQIDFTPKTRAVSPKQHLAATRIPNPS